MLVSVPAVLVSGGRLVLAGVLAGKVADEAGTVGSGLAGGVQDVAGTVGSGVPVTVGAELAGGGAEVNGGGGGLAGAV